jgi:hypothetical protein
MRSTNFARVMADLLASANAALRKRNLDPFAADVSYLLGVSRKDKRRKIHA